MSKYASRIDKLITKTHQFVSHRNICLARDYYKALLDECEKSEDFEKEYDEFKKFAKKIRNGSDEDKAKFREILKTNQAILYRMLYEVELERCNEYPLGLWLEKPGSEHYLKLVSSAKRYFKEKSQE